MSILPFPSDASTVDHALTASTISQFPELEKIVEDFTVSTAAHLASGLAGTDFERFERQASALSREVLGGLLKFGIEQLDDGAGSLTRNGKNFTRVEATSHTVMTSAGPVTYSRSRYRRAGEASIVPVDEKLGLAAGYFTPLAARQAVFLMSHNTARDCVSLYGELGVEGASVSSLQRLTTAAAEQWESSAGQGLAEIRGSEAIPVEAAAVCISLDGVMVPMLPEEREDKKTLYREASCGTVSYYDDEGERLKTLYFGQMPEPRKFTLKAQLAAEVAALAERRPDLQPVAVADAAADNWTFLSTLAPGDLQLIDYWHACQHLKCVADHAFGGDPAAAETWFQKYRGIPGNDEDGVERVIRAIRYRHAANGKSVAALERELKFFRKHRRRMRYAVHQANHLPIGSGVVESACRTLVSERMKKSGQRWGMAGGQAVLTLRALVRSGRFDVAWKTIAAQWKTSANDNGTCGKQSAAL